MQREKLTAIFSHEILRSRDLFIQQHNHDPIKDPSLWERVIAEALGGETTTTHEAWDVVVDMWGRSCRVEVKFSRAYPAAFAKIRGNECSRNVFKWAGLRKGRADCFIMVGLDVDDTVIFLVVPDRAIEGSSKSLTVTAPSSARSKARMDGFSVGYHDLLAAVGLRCHNALDAQMRAAGIKARRKLTRALGDLLDPA